MKPPISRTLVAGVAGGVGFGLTTFLTFVLIGSGLDHRSGPLFDPSLQSSKVLAVWTQMEPLPLFVTKPHLMLLGYVVFGIGHALLYRSVASAWPEPVAARIWRLAAIMWSLSYVFFEFLGPFNLLGEPLRLVALELSFWALAALVEATIIVLMLERPGAAAGRAFVHSATGIR
jgi:hypothetical protein